MNAEPPDSPAGSDLREYARQLVADWPPLTAHQRSRLAILLRPSPSASVATLPAADRRRKPKAA